MVADVDITRSVQGGLNELAAFVPELIAAILILIVGYFVAKVIGNVIGRLTNRAGLDRALLGGGTGGWVRRVTSSPSRLIGRIAFWALFLGVISLAVSVLGVSALSAFVGAIFAYLPNVIAALLIFLVAGAVAAGVATLATRLLGDTGLGKIVAVAAPILVMTIATFMILDQLKIAENIVTITYAGLIGAIALGSALAFGLGGRDVAARMLEGAYTKGQERKAEFKRDLDRGIQRGREAVEEQREKVESPQSTGATTRPSTR